MLFAALWLSVGCNVTKHLDTSKGERLLTKNSLEFKAEKKVSLSTATALRYEMGGLYRQQPNSAVLGQKLRLYIFYSVENKTSKTAGWLRKKVAEPPVIYDDQLARQTAENFKNFMAQRGYFNATCTYHTDTTSRYKAKTAYTLHLGPRYEVSTVQFTTKDSVVMDLLPVIRRDTRIKPGIPVDVREFDAEKLRINALMKERGFARFFPGYIEYNGDSTGAKVAININILPQSDTSFHQKYHIGAVSVFSSLVPEVSAMRSEDTLHSIHYYSNEPKFFIKPRHLDRLIKTRPGELFQQSKLDQTNRNLGGVGAFKFVSVRPQQAIGDTMNMDVFFSPANLWSVGFDPNFNYSTASSTGGLLGFSSSAFLKNRNLFRGAELLQINLSGNIEFDISKPDNPVFSRELKWQNTLIFPRYFDYFGLWRGLHALGVGNKRVVSNRFYRKLKEEANVSMNLTYDYLLLSYSYNLFNASFGYKFPRKNARKFEINHLGIDLLRPQISDEICATNPFLCLNFSNQLFTGLLFRSFSYALYTPQNRAGERWSLLLGTDLSGAEVALAGAITGKSFKEWKGLEISRYGRIDLSGSYSRNFTRDLFAGIRLATGVVQPYGGSTGAPYVKQFYVGGPSSIRAWRLRQLGPGTYFDPGADTSLATFLNAADFKFEFNAEVRFPVFWWFKGAVFVDGGNIWTIKEEQERPGSQLLWSSYKNMAIGTGAGLRFDFGYSVIRFDMGLKLRYPYPLENGGYWVNRDATFKELVNWNLAVGYPF